MGWRDDPTDEAPKGGGWRDDPVAPGEGLVSRVAKGVGSTLWDMVKPGQYPLPPAASPRQPGEDDKAYAIRTAHESMREAGSPEGVGRAAAMLGYSMPGGAAKPSGSPSGRLASLAETAAVRSANADRTAFRRAFKGNDEARHDLGRFMLDTGMPLRSPQAIRDAAQEMQSAAGPMIGDLTKKADAAGGMVDLASAVNAAKSDRSVARLSRNTVTRTKYDEIVGMLDDQLAQHGGQVPPSTAHDIRMQLDELANWDQAAPKQVQQAWRAARGALDSHLDASMDGAGLGKDWSEANAVFSKSRKLSSPNKRGLADIGAERRDGNRWGSPSEKGSALLGAATAGLVNPLAGVALPASTILLNRYGMPATARAADFLAKHPVSVPVDSKAAGLAQALRARMTAAAADEEGQ